MTGNQLAAEGIDLDRASDKVASILRANSAAGPNGPGIQVEPADKPIKKPRSDKGIPRKPAEAPAPAPEGALTPLQVGKIKMFTERIMEAHKREIEANRAVASLEAEYSDYLDSLTR